MENSNNEMQKTKICDLPISDTDKRVLTLCLTPTNIPNLCAKMNLAYSTVNQKILVLTAKGYLKREKSISGKQLIKTRNYIKS